MNRSDIENAAEQFRSLVWLTPDVINFAIEQVNATLSELERQIEASDGFGSLASTFMIERINSLKIPQIE